MANSDRMHLRPMEESDLETCRRVDTDPSLTRPFEWPGFHDHREHQRRWEEDGFLGAHSSRLAIANPDGSCAGFVNWWAADTMSPSGGCLEFGILLLPEHRGKGRGTATQRELADYLFATTLAHPTPGQNGGRECR